MEVRTYVWTDGRTYDGAQIISPQTLQVGG